MMVTMSALSHGPPTPSRGVSFLDTWLLITNSTSTLNEVKFIVAQSLIKYTQSLIESEI
jgi:hypothetical protein